MVKFSPAALKIGYDFVLLVLFLGHPVCHHKPNQSTCLPQNSKKSLRLEYLRHTQRPFLPLKQLVGLLSTYTFNHIFFLSREYCCAVLHFWVLYSLHLLSTEIPFLQAGSCQCWFLPFLFNILSANDHFQCSHWILSTFVPLCHFSLTWSLPECRWCDLNFDKPDLLKNIKGHRDHGKSRQDSPPCEGDEGPEDLQACPLFHRSSVPHVYSEPGTRLCWWWCLKTTLTQAYKELGLLMLLVGVCVLTFAAMVFFAEKVHVLYKLPKNHF